MTYPVVYLVTTGESSDYNVILAFTTRELAQAWCDAAKDDDTYGGYYGWYRIEEYPLVSSTPAPKQIIHARSAEIFDGAVARQSAQTLQADEWDPGYGVEADTVRTVMSARRVDIVTRGTSESAVAAAFKAAVAAELGAEPQ